MEEPGPVPEPDIRRPADPDVSFRTLTQRVHALVSTLQTEEDREVEGGEYDMGVAERAVLELGELLPEMERARERERDGPDARYVRAYVPYQLEVVDHLTKYLERVSGQSRSDRHVQCIQACITYSCIQTETDRERRHFFKSEENLTAFHSLLEAIEKSIAPPGPLINIVEAIEGLEEREREKPGDEETEGEREERTRRLQPTDIITALADSADDEKQAVIRHPIFEYVLDPARNYDMVVNGPVLAELLAQGISNLGDKPWWTPFKIATEGLFASLVVPFHPRSSTRPGHWELSKQELYNGTCFCLAHHYLAKDGTLKRGAIREFPCLSGPVSKGVPQCVIDTLTLCYKECGDSMEGEDPSKFGPEYFLTNAIPTFLALHETGAFESAASPLRVQRLPLPTRFYLGFRAVQVGPNRVLLVTSTGPASYSVTEATVTDTLSLSLSEVDSTKPELGEEAEEIERGERERVAGGGFRTADGQTPYMGSDPVCINGKVYICRSEAYPLKMHVLSLDTMTWEIVSEEGKGPFIYDVSMARLGEDKLVCAVQPDIPHDPIERITEQGEEEGDGEAEDESESSEGDVGMEESSSSSANNDPGVVYPWILDTHTNTWTRGAPSPPIFSLEVEWELRCHTVGGDMYLTASSEDTKEQIHLSYTAPSAAYPEGVWTQHASEKECIGMQDVGDGLSLSFDKNGHVCGHDAVSSARTKTLCTLPGVESLTGPYKYSAFDTYTSCVLSDDSILVTGLRRVPTSLKDMVINHPRYCHEEYYLIDVEKDCLRQRCQQDSAKGKGRKK
ncbi:hypothetical protein KIPB_000151 [Kipferlia bialata]|uniref:Uncharacterized protein n=1 Tax=Kipferlia bialata TaxID=797122 RepID=A0A9K3GEH8_9EUKA|nr:hypothetical protein KIPB_000151 [Kipferlia bialata]|eukprot:g151.t1